MAEENEEDHILNYGDANIASAHAAVPRWIKVSFCILLVWGIATAVIFWNGSTVSWLDPGHWNELQKAANTTFPSINLDKPQG